MKKVFRKKLSGIMALVMIFVLIPFGEMQVYANKISQSNIHHLEDITGLDGVYIEDETPLKDDEIEDSEVNLLENDEDEIPLGDDEIEDNEVNLPEDDEDEIPLGDDEIEDNEVNLPEDNKEETPLEDNETEDSEGNLLVENDETPPEDSEDDLSKDDGYATSSNAGKLEVDEEDNLPKDFVSATPSDAEKVKVLDEKLSDIYYLEDFTYPDNVGIDNFLPKEWTSAGVIPSVAVIRQDEGDNYYYELGRPTGTGSSYIGKIFTNVLDEYQLSYNLMYQNEASVDLFMYEGRLNSGNLAIRVGIKKDSNGGSLYAFDGGTSKTLMENVEDLGWVNISYVVDNVNKQFEIVVSDLEGEIIYSSDLLSYNNQAATKAGAFSVKCEVGASICIDNVKLDEIEAEVAEPGEPLVDFYYEDFTYPDETENDAFLPADWSMAGVMPSTATIIEADDNYYYEIDRTGDSGSSYIGKRFTMTLPDQYVVSLDLNYTNAANVNLFMYDNGLNTGNLAIRSGITKNNEGGNLFAFDGSTSKVLLEDIESYDWINLSYIIDNVAKSFEIVIADLEGEVIYRSGKLSFNNSSGKAGAFSVNCSQDATIQIDNLRISGEDKPYKPSPVEKLPLETGKVSLTDNGTEYILSNDYTKMKIRKSDATVTSLIRYISEHSELEDGGYEVLGGGTGYYLLNYVLNGTRGQCAVKNAVGEIVTQEDEYCEVVVTLDDMSYSPVALEFHFVLEADTEGVYMYARSRRATGVTGDVGIEQSRYSFRVDSKLYGYSAVADRDLEVFPEFEDYRGRVFDATYIMDDGSIYTKYNNNSYQYNSFVCGSYGEEFGFSLITPSRDWAGGGYTKQDIDVHDSGSNTTRLVNWHFATSHYGTGWSNATQDWEKLYGPVLWYANYGDSKEEIREAAIKKTEEEIQNWPYSWVDDNEYSAHTRSEVTGTFSITNGEIVETNNDISPEGTCGWAVLSDSRSQSWQKDNDYYEYYAPIQDDGSFTITGIRPGTYRINLNVNGIIGEYEQDNIAIGANAVIDLGDIVWNNPIYGETLWTIGIPDRTSEEYAGGKPYRLWGSHLMFDQLFPDGITYKIGESDYTEDWYFVHMASQTAGMLEHHDGSFYFDEDEKVVRYDASLGTSISVDDERWKGDQATTWDILFDNDKNYESGTATLLVAIAGGRAATLVVDVNGVSVTEVINITEAGGGYPRSAALDQYVVLPIEFDASLLVEGENVITLSHDNPSYEDGQAEIEEMKAYKSIMYDAIRLDVDANEAETQITHIDVLNPDKLIYMTGESFNPAGMVITAYYSDGSAVNIPYTSCTISGFDSDSSGEKNITISYKGFNDYFTITVNDRAVRYSTDSSDSSTANQDQGWSKDSNGWKYVKNNGTYAENEWQSVNGEWYYFTETGYAGTGWISLNEQWYWLTPGTGAMVENDWTFYQENWYFLGNDGAMVTGWKEYQGDWYYLIGEGGQTHGRMLTDAKTPDGYYVDSNGKWLKADL